MTKAKLRAFKCRHGVHRVPYEGRYCKDCGARAALVSRQEMSWLYNDGKGRSYVKLATGEPETP